MEIQTNFVRFHAKSHDFHEKWCKFVANLHKMSSNLVKKCWNSVILDQFCLKLANYASFWSILQSLAGSMTKQVSIKLLQFSWKMKPILAKSMKLCVFHAWKLISCKVYDFAYRCPQKAKFMEFSQSLAKDAIFSLVITLLTQIACNLLVCCKYAYNSPYKLNFANIWARKLYAS